MRTPSAAKSSTLGSSRARASASGYCQVESDCPESETLVDARGTSPSGEIHIDRVRVYYEVGFKNATFLILRGSLAGHPIEASFTAVDYSDPEGAQFVVGAGEV